MNDDDEAYEAMHAAYETMDTLTPEKLRMVADYIDECDSIMKKMLVRANAAFDAIEFVDGKAMQTDLRAWADAIDVLDADRAALDTPKEETP